ncbi:hypothetical protein [Lysinibacillus sp. FSL K6-0102]|uniref:hypothetical protein n=1 Tax=Lysinibacillus sp. FSL K6-0102 TaxID=2975290 RepID=UPI0030F69CC6
MAQIKLVYVERGDFEWLYVDDLIDTAGHKIGNVAYLSLINEKELDGSYAIYEVTDNCVDEYGGDLPNDFNEIPSDELTLLNEKAMRV